MELSNKSLNERYKIAFISVLIGLCWILTFFFHIILDKEVVFTHFFYIPIILASIWWKRKALIVTSLLVSFLIITNLWKSFSIPLEDFARIIIFYFVTVVVITLSEQMEKSKRTLKESEEKYRSVFNSAKEAIVLISSDGKIVSCNKGAESMFKLSEQDLLDKSIISLLPNRYIKPIQKIFLDINKTNISMDSSIFSDLYAIKSDGTEFPIEISIVNWKSDKKLFFTAIIRDITKRKESEKVIRENEKKFRTVFNEVNDIITLINIESDGRAGNFIEVNDVALNKMEYSKEEFKMMSPRDIGTQDSGNKILIQKLLNDGQTTFERVYRTKSGKEIPVEINSHLFELEGKKVALSVARDITERKIHETQLKESEERYRTLFQFSPDYIVLLDLDGKILEINRTLENILGMDTESLRGKFFYELPILLPENIPRFKKNIEKLLSRGHLAPYQSNVKDMDGNEHWIDIYNAVIKKEGSDFAILVIANDITQRKLAEDELKISLTEKELLLKEIHHRVKNNLMIISSLLNIQSSYIKDKEARGIFKESQNRAKSMALIHERLYQSTDLKKIDMGDYIRTLSNNLFDTYVTNPDKIHLHLDIEDISVDINTSIPLGLIINELVTNALKHAFPDDSRGNIYISLHLDDDKIKLEVSDDGIGFPSDIDYKNANSLGMQLINNLSLQIDSELKLISDKGTSFQIIFAEKHF